MASTVAHGQIDLCGPALRPTLGERGDRPWAIVQAMKSRAILFLLLVSLVWVPLSHLEVEPSDDSWLLRVDGVPFDVRG